MPKRKDNIFKDILLEIGTEPLPAGFIYSLIKQLKDNTKKALKDNNIIFRCKVMTN